MKKEDTAFLTNFFSAKNALFIARFNMKTCVLDL